MYEGIRQICANTKTSIGVTCRDALCQLLKQMKKKMVDVSATIRCFMYIFSYSRAHEVL